MMATVPNEFRVSRARTLSWLLIAGGFCLAGLVAAGMALAAATVAAESVQIEHQAVGCVVTNTFPELEARFQVATSIARARVYFRTPSSAGWHFVEMAANGGSHVGRLPKPGKGLESFDYYIEATGANLEAGRTVEYTVRVVAQRVECAPDVAVAVAGAAGPASIAAPPGAPPVPARFTTAGLTGAADAVAGGAAAGAGTSTGVILGVLGAAAAGGAAAVAGTPPPASPSPAPNPTKAVEFWLNADQITNGPIERGDRVTFLLYSGGWATLEEAQAGLAGQTASISVDVVPLLMYYTDWVTGPLKLDYHKQAMADWTATSGTHAVTGFWTVPGYRAVTRTFSVP